MAFDLLWDSSNFAPCKGENENQRIASVGHGRAGRIQRCDGVMKYVSDATLPEGNRRATRVPERFLTVLSGGWRLCVV
jgi:hypothetical protein